MRPKLKYLLKSFVCFKDRKFPPKPISLISVTHFFITCEIIDE